ncbi:hypothetical protein Q9L42_015050 [Methylomarinum sp. Ch1-1]|uniref:Lipoprotein n=1 Tax=Methylomarinum roseum TaxID=3067653 RepID=A0AAU7NRP4_9GAMM|nr:hypothetical protein [Methylomarinum sp. Ch1-1]MDP4520361.1 hypothetical protein [Methylomarinum sp. Ch1-1]
MKPMKLLWRVVLVLLLFATASGCAELFRHRTARYASGVVDYLYPNKESIETPEIPHLLLPLQVGIAFVPESKAGLMDSRLSEQEKMDLMERISAEFKKSPLCFAIELKFNENRIQSITVA